MSHVAKERNALLGLFTGYAVLSVGAGRFYECSRAPAIEESR